MKISSLLIVVAIALALVLVKVYFLPIFQPIGKKLPAEEKILLPEPAFRGIPVEEAILKRRSVREYSEEDLTLDEVSQVLWAAQGITNKAKGFRTAPSAGALYPLELYLVTREGVYHYDPFDHALERRFEGDVRRDLARAALDQEWIAEAPASIVITGIFERTAKKYGDRGERYVYMEAGHVGQNIYLQCASLDLGTVVVGAFYDVQVQEVLKLPGDYRPLYIVPIGHKKGGKE
jgi:SagB-type dehydrogenase family enzyme